jgi:hypothetical protein
MATQIRRLTVVILATALAALAVAASLTLTGCGDEEATKEATPTVAPTAQTIQPSPAPTQTRQWSFRGQRGITVAFPPADLALYRSLIPAPFEMPDTPLVAVAVVYYYDVTLPLTPYNEGYVVLQCKYQGRTGWYVLTMPVDNETANAGGRSLGFPKYIADKIDLGETNGVWSGRVVYQGRSVMQVTFRPQAGSEPVTSSSSDPGAPVFLLVPPGEGPQVNEVNNDLVGERRTVTTSGSATVAADPGESWAGLLPAGGVAAWASLEEMTGDWILDRKSVG